MPTQLASYADLINSLDLPFAARMTIMCAVCVVLFWAVYRAFRASNMRGEDVCAMFYCLGLIAIVLGIFGLPDGGKDRIYELEVTRLKHDQAGWLIAGNDRQSRPNQMFIRYDQVDEAAADRIDELQPKARAAFLVETDLDTRKPVVIAMELEGSTVFGADRMSRRRESMAWMNMMLPRFGGGLLLITVLSHIYIRKYRPRSRSDNQFFVFGVPLLISIVGIGMVTWPRTGLPGWVGIIGALAVYFPIGMWFSRRPGPRRVAWLSYLGKFADALTMWESLPAEKKTEPNCVLGVVRAYHGTGRSDKAAEMLDSLGDPASHSPEIRKWIEEWRVELAKSKSAEPRV